MTALWHGIPEQPDYTSAEPFVNFKLFFGKDCGYPKRWLGPGFCSAQYIT
jgi:hypothetical protein